VKVGGLTTFTGLRARNALMSFSDNPSRLRSSAFLYFTTDLHNACVKWSIDSVVHAQINSAFIIYMVARERLSIG